MRPHVRRRTRVILVSVALSLTGVAGCSSSTTPDVETVAAAPTVAASQGAAQILATYKNFMTEYVKAYNTGDPNNPDFTSLGGGNAAGLQTVIQDAIDQGITAIGQPQWAEAGRPVRRRERNDRVGDVLLRSGHLENREDRDRGRPSPVPSTPPLDATGHPPHPAYPDDAVGQYTVLMLLNRNTAGKWTVAQTNAQPDRPCDRLAPCRRLTCHIDISSRAATARLSPARA